MRYVIHNRIATNRDVKNMEFVILDIVDETVYYV